MSDSAFDVLTTAALLDVVAERRYDGDDAVLAGLALLAEAVDATPLPPLALLAPSATWRRKRRGWVLPAAVVVLVGSTGAAAAAGTDPFAPVRFLVRQVAQLQPPGDAPPSVFDSGSGALVVPSPVDRFSAERRSESPSGRQRSTDRSTHQATSHRSSAASARAGTDPSSGSGSHAPTEHAPIRPPGEPGGGAPDLPDPTGPGGSSTHGGRPPRAPNPVGGGGSAPPGPVQPPSAGSPKGLQPPHMPASPPDPSYPQGPPPPHLPALPPVPVTPLPPPPPPTLPGPTAPPVVLPVPPGVSAPTPAPAAWSESPADSS